MESTNTSAVVSATGSNQGSGYVLLSEPQVKALEWLTSGGSITEAAQFAGVSRQTVSKWLHQDADFQAVYDGWREQIAVAAEGQMYSMAESAAATIGAAIRDGKDVKAAQFVMKQLIDMNRARKTNGR